MVEEKLASAEVKLSAHDAALATERLVRLDAQSQMVAMQAEMSRMKDSMDRLMAALAPTTKLASAE